MLENYLKKFTPSILFYVALFDLKERLGVIGEVVAM